MSHAMRRPACRERGRGGAGLRCDDDEEWGEEAPGDLPAWAWSLLAILLLLAAAAWGNWPAPE